MPLYGPDGMQLLATGNLAGAETTILNLPRKNLLLLELDGASITGASQLRMRMSSNNGSGWSNRFTISGSLNAANNYDLTLLLPGRAGYILQPDASASDPRSVTNTVATLAQVVPIAYAFDPFINALAIDGGGVQTFDAGVYYVYGI